MNSEGSSPVQLPMEACLEASVDLMLQEQLDGATDKLADHAMDHAMHGPAGMCADVDPCRERGAAASGKKPPPVWACFA